MIEQAPKPEKKITLTLQGGLLREPELQPSLKILKSWEEEGKVELFETDRLKESAATQALAAVPTKPAHPRYKPKRKADSGAVSFQRVSAVLFPGRDTHRLNMTEINYVSHLISHHNSHRSIFVTANTGEFIDQGKRQRLLAAFKIVVYTPEETVEILKASNFIEPLQKLSV